MSRSPGRRLDRVLAGEDERGHRGDAQVVGRAIWARTSAVPSVEARNPATRYRSRPTSSARSTSTSVEPMSSPSVKWARCSTPGQLRSGCRGPAPKKTVSGWSANHSSRWASKRVRDQGPVEVEVQPLGGGECGDLGHHLAGPLAAAEPGASQVSSGAASRGVLGSSWNARQRSVDLAVERRRGRLPAAPCRGSTTGRRRPSRSRSPRHFQRSEELSHSGSRLYLTVWSESLANCHILGATSGSPGRAPRRSLPPAGGRPPRSSGPR